MSHTHKSERAAQLAELVSAATAALEALNEASGSSLALESLAKGPGVDDRIARVLRTNLVEDSNASIRLRAALAPFVEEEAKFSL